MLKQITKGIAVVWCTGICLFSGCQGRTSETVYTSDIEPGKKSALLTYGNGKRVRLEDLKIGDTLMDVGTVIRKEAEGKLRYTAIPGKDNGRNFNILATFSAQEVQVVFEDGSSVWLNSASSLIFPTTFAVSDHRSVRLSGEAYFEIVKNEARPFFVKTNLMDARTIGARFDVSNYSEEQIIRTIPLDSGVQVNGGTPLRVGQQAEVTSNGTTVSKVNPELAVAWKNGKFLFEKEGIEQIMRPVARWYGAEVVYEGELPDGQFSLSVPRTDKVSKILHALESNGDVHFRIEDKKITVLK